MKKIIATIALICAFLFVSACAGMQPGTSSPAATSAATTIPTQTQAATAPVKSGQSIPALTGIWQINFSQSGGIMGMSKSAVIDSNGAVTVTDQRTNKTSSQQLSPSDLAALASLVESSSYNPDAGPKAVCADCFVYQLEIVSGGRDFKVQLNDISLPDSGLGALVGYLVKLMRNTTGN